MDFKEVTLTIVYIVYMILYVDDMIIAIKSMVGIVRIKAFLNFVFEIKELV